MAEVTVEPATFTMVEFDAGTIAAVVERVADDVGLPADLGVRLEVDEKTPLMRSRVESIDPVTLSAESGAFEDLKHPRHLSEVRTADVVGRLLFRVADRLDESFGDPGDDADLSLPRLVAWDCYAVARMARLGYKAQRQRRLYHFRNRHGFTDVGDAAFDTIWTSESLTWDDLVRLSDESLAAAPAA